MSIATTHAPAPFHRRLAGIAASVAIGLLGATAARADEQEVKDLLAGAAKSEIKALKKAVKELRLDFSVLMTGATAELKKGNITPQQAIDLGATFMNGFIDLAQTQARQRVFNLQAFASSLLVSLPGTSVPLGFLVGDCGTTDVFIKKLELEMAKVRAFALKRFKKLAKIAKKKGANLSAVVPAPAAGKPVPGASPATPAKELTQPVTLGGSDPEVIGDGQLSVTGVAKSGTVSVKITHADGFSFTENVTVDANCRYLARFDGLLEGNWTVEVSQGGTTLSETIGVP